jgi:Zn-dependent protease/CBS domain-containing protein
VLITASLGGGLFPSWHPEWSTTTAWGVAIAAAILFFASVLLHELAHALVGRRFGIDVRRITLFIFGGVAQLEREPGRWSAELWMAIVGPITSLVIALLCGLAVPNPLDSADAMTPAGMRDFIAQLGVTASLLLWLGQVNLVLALFNLVPAFPLDGGRVLRAVLWGATGDLRKATRWASGLGQVFAWILIALGLGMILGLRVPVFGSGVISGVWLAFIGWFLNNAALMSYRQLLARETLEGVRVARVMATRFESVSEDITVQSLLDDIALRGSQRAFPVVRDGLLVGIVCLQDIRGVSPEDRRSRRVGSIMKPVEQLKTLTPEDDALEALQLLARWNVAQAPVVREGRVVGMVRREDILRWLTFNAGGHDRPPPATARPVT